MAELVLRLKDRELSRVPVLNTRMTLGREASSDLVIDNAGVSRTHAILLFVDGQYRIRDADSQNGVMLNGRPTKESVVEYGDKIGIGKFEIELVESDHQYEMQPGEQPKLQTAKNVMGTMQMDPAAAARLRDEAMARLAGQKGGASSGAAGALGAEPRAAGPAGAASKRPAAQAQAKRKPAPAKPPSAPPAPAQSDTAAILKVVGLGLLLVVVMGGAALFMMSK
jgi:predicted component of type VI protein secretion system